MSERVSLGVSHRYRDRAFWRFLNAFDALRTATITEPIDTDDPGLRRRVGDYLATQADILRRFHGASTTAERNAALDDLVAHGDQHRDLIDEAARYQTSHGNYAKDPFADQREPATTDEPAQPKPTKRTPARKTTR